MAATTQGPKQVSHTSTGPKNQQQNQKKKTRKKKKKPSRAEPFYLQQREHTCNSHARTHMQHACTHTCNTHAHTQTHTSARTLVCKTCGNNTNTDNTHCTCCYAHACPAARPATPSTLAHSSLPAEPKSNPCKAAQVNGRGKWKGSWWLTRQTTHVASVFVFFGG